MDKFGLSPSIVAKGVDHAPLKTKENPQIVDMLNMNTGYILMDLALILLDKDPRTKIAFILHHIAVIAATTVIKIADEGSSIHMMLYTYADIPTVILHSLWFLRNLGMNLKSLFALFNKKSVKQSAFLDGHNDIDQEIEDNISRLDKIEKAMLLTFSASFIYVRCVVFTKILPLWYWNSLKSKRFGVTPKVIVTVFAGGLLGVGYMWSYKVTMKLLDGIDKTLREPQKEMRETAMLSPVSPVSPQRLLSPVSETQSLDITEE